MGSGQKTFVSGPLSSADVNNYLMKQAVIACTSSTRPSAPETGMTIFETDTEKYRYWSGTGWRHLGPTRLVYGQSGTGLNFTGTNQWVDTGIACQITTVTENANVEVGLLGDVSVSAAGGGGMQLGLGLDSGAPLATQWWIYDNVVGLRLTLPLYLGDFVIPAAGNHSIKLYRQSAQNGGTYSLNNVSFRNMVAD